MGVGSGTGATCCPTVSRAGAACSVTPPSGSSSESNCPTSASKESRENLHQLRHVIRRLLIALILKALLRLKETRRVDLLDRPIGTLESTPRHLRHDAREIQGL